MKKRFALFVVACLVSCMFIGCGSSETSLNASAETETKQTDKSSNNVTKDNVQKKKIDEPVLVVNTFYQAQINMDLETALSCCSRSLRGSVESVNNELVQAFEEIKNSTMDTCVSTTQNLFWNIADDDDSLIDASYLYEEESLVESIEKLARSATSGIVYELPEKAKMISEDEAEVVLDVSAGLDVDLESNWAEEIGGYLKGSVIDKFMDDAGIIKKGLLKAYITQELVDQMDDLRSKYENAEITPTFTRTYYLKKDNNTWLVTGYKVIKAEDGSVNVYGDVPDADKNRDNTVADYEDDSYDEESDYDDYYDDEYYDDESDYDDYYDDAYYDDESDYDGYYDDAYYDNEYNQYDFILPHSSTNYLDEDDLRYLSAADLTYARNEIFARHGYVFKSNELNEYFQSKAWYEADYNFDGSLSDVEAYNAEFIKSYQNDYDLMYVPK